ncbi:SDR family NAD(P)-dependent oxidoreductase [uncultured Rhodoferax sp.]|uniref:SDR family NAD(P)-dependent oxidoreductase n=1 Tax=uncultured Rhodoferax sp. TaxID=223188 RepID=UPI0025EE58DB|nr:SDR family NAD(P)-dependent oxidoreductase [uncultured Rhodoferax sp.]
MLQRVLITGGAHRLGALLCNQFAQAGWEVWCHYQRSADAAEALCASLRAQGHAARAIQARLEDEDSRRIMVQTIAEQSGPLHCLVNNASSFEPDAGAAMDVAGARQQLEVNLLAPLSLSSLMAQTPLDAPAGNRSIVHVLDQKVFNLNPDYFSYTVTKLALERAVALQAQALAPAIRVCGVAPGLMFLSGPQTQANFEQAARVNLQRTPLDPAQVAATCLFLAQNSAINGVTIAVDNGQHLVPLERDVMFMVEGNAQ